MSDKKDVNQIAKIIGDFVTGKIGKPIPPEKPYKNPAAVEMGRLGGLKGGPARAAKLTAEERSEISRKGWQTRWHKDCQREDFVKECKRHGSLSLDQVRQDGKYLRCRLCEKAKFQKYDKTSRKPRTEERIKKCYASKHRQINKLGDSYVRELLTQNSTLRARDIPQTMVDVKKVHLEIYRLTQPDNL